MSNPKDSYSWDAANIVVPEQWRTDVYWNGDGDLVIRQDQGDLEHPFIVIPKDRVEYFWLRIRSMNEAYDAENT